ncbi:hypothetical protein [Nocardioides sp. LML1-1-1.1]|uniref:hypothetical protein n=1 Tax=Nocardioides sp. LML1-1-1.1 TaxID=3135248 RepID=UPI0034199F46
MLPGRGASEDLAALLAAYDALVEQLAEVQANRDRLAHQVVQQRAELADLHSRIGCVLEATSMDRPYDTRLAAIRRMCDLTTNGFTPASTTSPTTEGA